MDRRALGTTYRENLPGGGRRTIGEAGHVAELWVRERATGTSARLAGTSCRELRQLGVTADGLYHVDADGFGPGPGADASTAT
ncbi:hypothetical protein L6R52_34535 [Myxococcota bacterium]|nr:hypothetical protein [Myxococcota bacterium]